MILEFDNLIPRGLCEKMVKETTQLESLIGTNRDPWFLKISAGNVKGHEEGGGHTFKDPMYEAVLKHHLEDPLSINDLYYWYHQTSIQNIEKVLCRRSVLFDIIQHIKSDNILDFLVNETGCSLKNSQLFLNLTRYGPGAFLSPHTDFDEENTYKLTFILYLNNLWHPYFGGRLVIKENNCWRAIMPEFGKSIIFLPSLETIHYVEQVHLVAPKPRFAVSGWFLTKKV